MKLPKSFKVITAFLPAVIVIIALYINASLTYASTPRIHGGLLDLSGWDLEQKGAFNLAGQWEFYWNQLLGDSSLKTGQYFPRLIDAPDIWNGMDIGSQTLPGFGQATYRAQITGIPEGEHLAVRIQNQASAYRLYVNEQLIASNGQFGDRADANASQYRPQYAEFTSPRDPFNMVLQVSNHAYAVGGMWEPILFGSSENMAGVVNAVKFVDYFSIGSLVVMCVFLGIMVAIVRKEKEALVLFATGILVLFRVFLFGEGIITVLIPRMPIAGFGWIDYLTQIWLQFFLLYFVFLTFTGLVNKWQIRILLGYSIVVSLFILLFPFEVVSSTYQVMSCILLLVLITIVVFTARAALEGRTGARSLLAAMAFILFSMLYEFLITDLSVAYLFINSWALDFTVLFIVQCTILARRYNEQQRLELGLLKNQIRPHFIHNALATIISISRKEPERSRELLVDFSSYLRGCYDYEGDDVIPLEEELEFVQAYVTLEQARFGDKLQVLYEIEVENFMLPPLILQPLVENAFIHGLREKEEGGNVVVYTKRVQGNSVRIGVRDDGVGLKTKQMNGLERSGIGIGNINRRLSRLYHTQLIFITPENGGCEAYMEIPYREVDSGESFAY